MARMNTLRIPYVLAGLLCACMLACATVLAPFQALAKGEPIESDPYAGAANIDVDNGEYFVDVVLEGGSGRASVASPAKLTVVDGSAAVALEWSSPNYDYMVVGGKQYLPVSAGGNSIFMVPVLAFDEAFAVVGDTTAMSEPHEIDYTLLVDSSSIRAFEAGTVASSQGSSGAGSVDAADAQAGGVSSSVASAGETGLGSSAKGPDFRLWAVVAGLVIFVAIGLLAKFGKKRV